MKTLLNLIWFFFGGLWLAIGYFVAGILACVLIVTIPLGVAAFRLGAFALWPFGKTIVRKPSAGAGSVIGNVLWIILFGWWLALGHIVTAVAQAITIIGLPLAAANLKMLPVSLTPFGVDIVSTRELAYARAAYAGQTYTIPE